MTRRIFAVAALLALAGCGTAPTTSTGGSGAHKPSTSASQASADTSPTGSDSCDSVATAVHALVPGTSDHTDKTVGGFELCTWDSTEAAATGMRTFFQATCAGASFFDGTSKGLDQSMTYMSGVKKLTPAGFDDAIGFWNAPTHTFSLLVERGGHSALLEGSVPQEPNIDALVGIAHTLVG